MSTRTTPVRRAPNSDPTGHEFIQMLTGSIAAVFILSALCCYIIATFYITNCDTRPCVIASYAVRACSVSMGPCYFVHPSFNVSRSDDGKFVGPFEGSGMARRFGTMEEVENFKRVYPVGHADQCSVRTDYGRKLLNSLAAIDISVTSGCPHHPPEDTMALAYGFFITGSIFAALGLASYLYEKKYFECVSRLFAASVPVTAAANVNPSDQLACENNKTK